MIYAKLSLAVLVTLVISAEATAREVPTMPNECAATRCAAMVASARLICAEENADEEVCNLVLRDLESCVEACTGAGEE